MTNAWHLKQDGEAFPVTVHLYPMQDEDLSSEAEVAAFMIHAKANDESLCKYIIDAWAALNIEDTVKYDADSAEIDDAIRNFVTNLPYKFAYPMSIETIIDIHHEQDNFNDVDSLYEFADKVRANMNMIWEDISHSFNQQFCRVRFGGKYNTSAGNSGIWFRIASVNYNWADTIYTFTTSMRRKLSIKTITICRDPESDNGYGYNGEDYFYTAKDGEVYYQMPIEEYLAEEHDHSPVFSSTSNNIGRGVYATVRNILSQSGNTLISASTYLSKYNIHLPSKAWGYFVKCEQKMCIESSEWSDSLHIRTASKIAKVENIIMSEFPEIEDIDVDCKPRENTKGKMVGFEMIFTLQSSVEALDHLEVSIVSTKPLSDVLAESIVRKFRIEYTDYIKYMNIDV